MEEHESLSVLPADIIHLISTQLLVENDFASLHNLVVSSRYLALSGALNALYRIAHECFGQTGSDGTTFEDAPPAEAREITMKNSILWRTIVLSALGGTFYPYCRHLRVLDLRDLSGMLQDDTFRTPAIYDRFFSGPMSQFLITVKATRSNRSVDRLKIRDSSAAMADVVIKHAPLLEGLTEHATETVFDRLESWLPNLAYLRRLDVGDGTIFKVEETRNLIRTHCPNLSELRIFSWNDLQADRDLAAILDGLRENSLSLFENLSDCNISDLTCTALNRHGQSLKTLSLAFTHERILALRKLTCTNVETLSIDWLQYSRTLYTENKDACLQIAEWLRTCEKLKDITLKNIIFAPRLLNPLLEDDKILLHSLTLTAAETALYDVRDHERFHTLLGRQSRLQELILAADADDASFQDRASMLASLSNLRSLRKLRAIRLADDFLVQDLAVLTDHLLELEDIYIAGIAYNDDNLKSMASLRRLKNVVIAGMSRFTSVGLLEFISCLEEGNRGISIQIDNADYDSALTSAEEAQVAKVLANHMDGTFRYNVGPDPNAPAFDESDED